MIEASPVYSRLTEVFRDCFENDDIVLRSDLTADDVPEWTSLSHIRLMLQVEESFKVRFAASEMSEMEDVGDLIALIEAKIAA